VLDPLFAHSGNGFSVRFQTIFRVFWGLKVMLEASALLVLIDPACAGSLKTSSEDVLQSIIRLSLSSVSFGCILFDWV